MNCKTLTIAIIVAVGGIVWIGLDLHRPKNGEKHSSPLGLKLVAKYEPLHLYIYADTASTNSHPDYLICEGNDDVVSRENAGSNTIETTFFENGYQVLRTKRDQNGKMLRRMVSYNDDSGRVQCTYIDNSGGGLWDVFLDRNRDMFYVQSNLCWVLKYQGTNQSQGSIGHSNGSEN